MATIEPALRDFLVSYKLPAVILPIYLFVIFVLHRWMKNREPFILKGALAKHNLFLCLLSLCMALFTAISILGRLSRLNWDFKQIYCPLDLGDFPGDYWLWAWCYIFYLSKYYELLDTVFLVLKKKPLTFLHVYHHAIIVLLCLFMVEQKMVFFFSGVFINASIHTFMYYYYFVSLAYGSNPWWKKHLTKGQIFQFMWGITSWWPYPFVCSAQHSDSAPHYDMWVWWFNQFVLISFLVLFLNFF